MRTARRVSAIDTVCGVVTTTLPATGTLCAQAERDVAGSRRHVDHQVVDVAPAHFTEELLDHPVQHRTAPDHRRVVAGQERHRDQLDAVLLGGQDLLSVGGQLGVDAQHDRHVRAVDVAVDHRDPAAELAERNRQVHRHRRLADAALAGADRDDVLHPFDRRLPHLRRRWSMRTCAVISMSTAVTPGSASTTARA